MSKKYKLSLKFGKYEVSMPLTEEFLEKAGKDIMFDFLKGMIRNIKKLSKAL